MKITFLLLIILLWKHYFWSLQIGSEFSSLVEWREIAHFTWVWKANVLGICDVSTCMALFLMDFKALPRLIGNPETPQPGKP